MTDRIFFSLTARRLRRSALVVPVALLCAVLMIVVSEAAFNSADSRLRRLVQWGSARIELMYLLRRVTEAETSKRGYMLTAGQEYLEPYTHARADVQGSLAKLKSHYGELDELVAEQHRRRIEDLVAKKLGEMDEVKRLFDAGRRDDALAFVSTGIGRDAMDDLRREADALIAYQNAIIVKGRNDVFDTLLLNRFGIAAMTLAGLSILILFLRQGRLLDQEQARRQAEIAQERDRLELEVQRRTAELTELARHLQTAREDERARLARELHDELGALLTTAKLDVARIRPKLQQSMPELLPRLTHLTESLNSGIALKRRIIEDLRPSTLSNLGLGPALEILCREFENSSGVVVTVHVQPLSLTASAELTVFRMVQESLTNVAKYAQARRVWVQMKVEGGHAVVNVRDDGVGFDATRVHDGHHGLVGMRFRLEAESGSLAVRSAPGLGTELEVRLPLHVAATTPVSAESSTDVAGSSGVPA